MTLDSSATAIRRTVLPPCPLRVVLTAPRSVPRGAADGDDGVGPSLRRACQGKERPAARRRPAFCGLAPPRRSPRALLSAPIGDSVFSMVGVTWLPGSRAQVRLAARTRADGELVGMATFDTSGEYVAEARAAGLNEGTAPLRVPSDAFQVRGHAANGETPVTSRLSMATCAQSVHGQVSRRLNRSCVLRTVSRLPIRYCGLHTRQSEFQRRSTRGRHVPTTTQAAPSVPPVASADAQKARKKKLAGLVVLLVAAVAGWYMLLGPGAQISDEPQAAPEPGDVVALEPITMNLADGRLLKIGLALQLPLAEGEEKEITGSVALDEAIAFLGRYRYTDLVSAEAREVAKAKLSARVSDRYHGEVMQVYFTEFVMQ